MATTPVFLDVTPAYLRAKLTNDEIDHIADSVMEPIESTDCAEIDLDRKVLRRFARECIKAALRKLSE